MTSELETGPRHARKRPRRESFEPVPFEQLLELLDDARARTATLPVWAIALAYAAGIVGTVSGWATYLLR